MHFPCNHCGAALDVADSFAGKRVCCGQCKTIQSAPALERWTETLRPLPPPGPPPLPALPRRQRGDPPRGRPQREEAELPKGTGRGTKLLLISGGYFLVLFLLSGVAAVLWFMSRSTVGPPPVAGVRPAPVDNVPPWERKEKGAPHVPPFRDEPRADPVGRAAMKKVTFDGGKFTTRLSFDDPAFVPGNQVLAYPLEFDARADGVYSVEAKGNRRVTVKIEGPNGPVNEPKDRLERERPSVAFHAPKGGRHTVLIIAQRFDKAPCEVEIRELADGEALPPASRLPSPSGELPALVVAQRLEKGHDKTLTAAAFALDGKAFYLAHRDGTLGYWASPENEQKGSYATKNTFTVLGVDGAGRVYAQMTKTQKSRSQSEVGPLLIWDQLRPTGERSSLPAPTTSLPIAGIITRLIASKDGKWMYALDIHNRKLLRIGGDRPKVETTLELGPSVTSYCLTPDGKKIYACASSNRIDEIDASTMKVLRSVRFDVGQPTDIAATNEGVCYLAGRTNDQFKGYGLVVDVGRTKGEQAEAAALGIRCHTQHAAMLPDQRAVLLSGDRRINVCSVSTRPTVFRTTHKEALYDGYNNPARAWVSPDGRTIHWDRGQIVSVSR